MWKGNDFEDERIYPVSGNNLQPEEISHAIISSISWRENLCRSPSESNIFPITL